MIDFKITLPDLKAIEARLGKLTSAQQRAMIRATNIWLLDVLRDSKEKPPRVPVGITGNLQSSGFTEPAAVVGGTIKAAIGYGGIGGVDYAVYVHDDIDSKGKVFTDTHGHGKNYNRPGSGPKFLETHVNIRRPELYASLAEALGTGAKELFS